MFNLEKKKVFKYSGLSLGDNATWKLPAPLSEIASISVTMLADYKDAPRNPHVFNTTITTFHNNGRYLISDFDYGIEEPLNTWIDIDNSSIRMLYGRLVGTRWWNVRISDITITLK